MSNFGPHLRHNQHHTLLPVQEKTCSQSSLHLHDQQPTIYSCISHYGLTTCLFIGFTTGKPLNTWCPKMVTDPCRSLATNPTNPNILSQSDYQSTTSQPSFSLQLVVSHPHFDLFLVDLSLIYSTLNLPDQIP